MTQYARMISISRLSAMCVLYCVCGPLVGIAAEAPAKKPADQPRKIVLIAGPKSHGPVGNGIHDYPWSVKLLKVMLDHSNVKDRVKVEYHLDGGPADLAALDDADTIMVISDGRDGDLYAEAPHFSTEERLAAFTKQMARGCGFLTFHFSTFAPDKYAEQILSWSGGYFDWETDGKRQWHSAITTKDTQVTLPSPEHPVLRGVKPFQLREEFYYNLRFQPDDKALVPLFAVPELPGREPDGRVVAWCRERADGGRGFGTTCGHFYDNWKNDDFRRTILNALVWSAGLDVPEGGVTSKVYTHAEITKALAGVAGTQRAVVDDEPLRVLMFAGNDAHKWHNWEKTTPAIKAALETDPRIAVDVTLDIEDLAKKDLAAYQVIVQNYVNWHDPKTLSNASRSALLKFVENGGGLILPHFSASAFHFSLPMAKESDWPEYRKLSRRVWDHFGQGEQKSGHDAFGPFTVDITGISHPVTKGLKAFPVVDELYFRQAGGEPIEPLITAKSKVTNRDEPLAWGFTYGKGRVFQTLLGHSEKTYDAFEAREMIRRAAAWTAGRRVLALAASEDPNPPLAAKPSSGASAAPAKPAATALALADGKFGKALDAKAGGALVTGTAAFHETPLTLELWAKLSNKGPYNILVAQEPKASPTHWELFTMAGSGTLTLYIPGRTPDHVRSQAMICDGQWHALAMTFDRDRVRLFVDGKEVANEKVAASLRDAKPEVKDESKPNSAQRETPNDQATSNGGSPSKSTGLATRSVAATLAIGRLVEGGLGCDGLIDDVRLSKGVREIKSAPTEPLPSDEATLGLWRFDVLDDAKKQSPDASKAARSAMAALGNTSGATQAASPTGGTADHFGKAVVGFDWTEKDSVDDRWKQTDIGPCLASSLPLPGLPVVAKGLSIKLGDANEATVCYDTSTGTLRGAWTGGFLRFNPARYGIISPPAIDGIFRLGSRETPGWSPGKARFLGHRLHGKRVLLEYEVVEVEKRNAADNHDRSSGTLPERDETRRIVASRDGDASGERALLTGGQSARLTKAVRIRESPWIATHEGVMAVTRAVEVGMTQASLTMHILDAPGAAKIETIDGVRVACVEDAARAGAVVVVAVIEPAAARTEDGSGDPSSSKNAARADTLTIKTDGGRVSLAVPAGTVPQRFVVLQWAGLKADLPKFAALVNRERGVIEKQTAVLDTLAKPGPARWTAPVVTRGVVSRAAGAYVVDTLTLPFDNPWKALLFCSGHDFFPNGDIAVCTVHGDVWRVSGVDDRLEQLTWKRFATGLFQPLGLKIVGDVVHVLGRDQITRLYDENGDGEADRYECFNNAQVTSPGGHDYVACLETDSHGDFHFVHANMGLVKVSKDGRSLSVVATGFRNPNGLGIGPHDEITVSPQEGNWTPASAIIAIQPGGYYGFGGPKVTADRPLGYDPPLLWLPRALDNSSGGQAWVTSDRWGPLEGHLLHFSFGQCRMMLGPKGSGVRSQESGKRGEDSGVSIQDSGNTEGKDSGVSGPDSGKKEAGKNSGAASTLSARSPEFRPPTPASSSSSAPTPESRPPTPASSAPNPESRPPNPVSSALNPESRILTPFLVSFPLEFDSGVMRGRFRPRDGQLYVSGLKGWVSSAVKDGCLQRVRYAAKPVDLPVELKTWKNGLSVTFTRPLDKALAEDAGNWTVQRWNYRWSAEYGSPEFKVSKPNEEGRDDVAVRSATMLDDGRTVFLQIPDMRPAMQTTVRSDVAALDGTAVKLTLVTTIPALGGESMDESRLAKALPARLPPEVERRLRAGLRVTRGAAGSADGVSVGPALKGAGATVARMINRAVVGPLEKAATPQAGGRESIRFEGWLKVPARGSYSFSFDGHGDARLMLDGQAVLSATGDLAQTPPRAVALRSGYNALVVEHRPAERTGAPPFRLLWSADDFATEPVPPDLLFHASESMGAAAAAGEGASGADAVSAGEAPSKGASLDDLALAGLVDPARHGRVLFAERHCGKCHTIDGASSDAVTLVPAADPPSLAGSNQRLRAEWIARWLLDPAALRNGARMPAALSTDAAEARTQAADLAAFLGSAEPPDAVDDPGDARVVKGRLLFEDLGCIACHRHSPPGEVDEFGRLSLAYIAAKHPAGALAVFLSKPHGHYAASRMPDFRLTNEEVAALSAYLIAESRRLPKLDHELPPGDAARGRALFRSKGCVNCHTTGRVPEFAPLPKTAVPRGGGPARGCLSLPAAAVGDLNGFSRRIGTTVAASLRDARREPPDKPNLRDIQEAEVSPRRHGDTEKSGDFAESSTRTPASGHFAGGPGSGRFRMLPSVVHFPGLLRVSVSPWCTQPLESGPADDALKRSLESIGDPTPKATGFATRSVAAALVEARDSPRHALTPAERAALGAFLEQVSSLPAELPAEASLRLARQLQCAACHPRDGATARRMPILIEESERGLVPETFPSLTWAGEKLHADWTRDLLAGRVEGKTRPWLRGRMPAFPSYADALARGLAAEHAVSAERPPLQVDAALVDAGRRLALKDALDCRQCHAFGNEPAAGDKGTLLAPGIDFALARRRLRHDWYGRFTLDPPRFDVGTRMPKLTADGRTSKVTTILDGDARKQFEALWHWMQR